MKRFLDLPPVSFTLELVDLCLEAATPRSAAALCYYLVLTLFPLLVCVNWFITLFRVNLLEFMEPLEQMLPGGAVVVIEDYLSYAANTQSPGLLAACIATLIMSASAGLRTVFLTLEDVARAPHRSTLWKMLNSVVLTVLLLATIYVSVIVVFTGDWFFNVLSWNLPDALLALIPLDALSDLWHWMRYLILFCFVLLLVLGVYGAGIPKGAVRKFTKLLCAVGTSAVLVAASALFSWFIGLSSRYALVYGSLASIILLLMWLYFIGNILFVGAAVGCLWTRRCRERKKTIIIQRRPGNGSGKSGRSRNRD